METTADYFSAILLSIIGIAVFINVKNGTLGPWLSAKFLGVGSASDTAGANGAASAAGSTLAVISQAPAPGPTGHGGLDGSGPS